MVTNWICPFCDYNCFSATDRLISTYYGKNYLSCLSAEERDYLSFTSLVSCNRCNSISPIKPIPLDFVRRIYGSLKSSHDMGWNTYERLHHAPLEDHQYFAKIVRIADLTLSKLSRSPIKYAEFGCPLMGYALFRSNSSLQASPFSFYPNASSLVGKSSFWLNRVFNIVIATFWRIRCIARLKPSSAQPLMSAKQNINSTFITSYSDYFWLGNCARYSYSCQGIADATGVFDRIVSLDSLSISDPFDVILVSNSIDHYKSGFSFIKKLLSCSRCVIFVSHDDSRFSAQHPYALTDQTIDWITSDLISSSLITSFSKIQFSEYSDRFLGAVLYNAYI